jgi:hypothetical protein
VPETTDVRRHGVDALALAFGLLSLAIAGLALVARSDLFAVDGLVVLASVWLVLGVVGLTRAVQRLLSRPHDSEA